METKQAIVNDTKKLYEASKDKAKNAFEDGKEILGVQSKLETEANKLEYELEKKKEQMKEEDSPK
jgi:hypothetical protein